MDPIFKKPSAPLSRTARQLWQVMTISSGEKTSHKRVLAGILFDWLPTQLVWQFMIPMRPSIPIILEESAKGMSPCTPLNADKSSGQPTTGIQSFSLPLREGRPEDSSPTGNQQPAEKDSSDFGQSRGEKRKQEDDGSDPDPGEPPRKVQKTRATLDRDGLARSAFAKLPDELIAKIISDLDTTGTVYFALTCRRFLGIGVKEIHDMFCSYLGPWAGESVICVGGSAKRGDYPEAIYYDEALRIAFQPENTDAHLDLYDYANKNVESVLLAELPMIIDSGLMTSKGFNDEFFRLPVPVIGEMIEVLCPMFSDFYPPGHNRILRNLTTREYVRKEALMLDPNYIPWSSVIRTLGFGDVILSRICWAWHHPPDVKIHPRQPIHRGVWAGHRFDIVPMDMHELEIQRDLQKGDLRACDWTDISDVINQSLGEIWADEYGETYRQALSSGARRYS